MAATRGERLVQLSHEQQEMGVGVRCFSLVLSAQNGLRPVFRKTCFVRAVLLSESRLCNSMCRLQAKVANPWQPRRRWTSTRSPRMKKAACARNRG